MQKAPQTIAALLGSRICHDLVSPIGAISNGVELLQMSGGGDSPELDLIHESVDNANARIRFFRIAFGIATKGQELAGTEIRDILADLTRGTRLDIDWQSASVLPRSQVKLVFLMIQCLEAALPWGGKIHVSQTESTWHVVADSDRLKDIAALWDALENPTASAEIGAAEVQFLLFPVMLDEQHRRLSLTLSDTRIQATF